MDEEEHGGLRGLADVLLGYGERHFDGPAGQKGSRRGMWAGVLLMCGQFERVRACHPWVIRMPDVSLGRRSTVGPSRNRSGGRAPCHCARLPRPPTCLLARRDIRSDPAFVSLPLGTDLALTFLPVTVSLPPTGQPSLSLTTLLWRYVRQFVKLDAKEALQYVCCVCLSADQGAGVGKEQVEGAWELVRRIIVLANAGAAWEELVGGLRPDGTRFVSPSLRVCSPAVADEASAGVRRPA